MPCWVQHISLNEIQELTAWAAADVLVELHFVSEFQTPNPNPPSGYECLMQNTVSWYMWVREIGCVFKEIPSCKSVEYSGSCWKLDLCSCIHQFPLHLGILNLSNLHWIYIISSVCCEKSAILTLRVCGHCLTFFWSHGFHWYLLHFLVTDRLQLLF